MVALGVSYMNRLFDSLQISGYRGIKMVDLPQLGQVNIFVGNNNSGKTSLLEAISILCNPLDPFQWIGISQRRTYIVSSSLLALRLNIEAIKWIFPQNIRSSTTEFYQSEISITASGNTPIIGIKARFNELYGSGEERPSRDSLNEDIPSPEADAVRPGVEIDVMAHLRTGQLDLFTSEPERKELFQFWENERFIQRKRNEPFVKNATIFPSYSSSEPLLSRLTQIILDEVGGGKGEVLELIRYFDANILDIQILSTPRDRAVLYIEHKELGFAPLYTFGDGLKRALAIALTLLTTKNGVLLIDEIETSIHVSALSKVFSWLTETCRQRKIQLFVTTHSLEAIDAMLQTEIATDDIVAFRLNSEGQPPQRFSGDLLHRLRSERGLDVR